jgi:hypothetical protein
MEACDYRVIGYQGEAIAAMPMGERLTLTNMSPELGAKTSVVPPDEITVCYLKAVGVDVADVDRWQSDDGAWYERSLELVAWLLLPNLDPSEISSWSGWRPFDMEPLNFGIFDWVEASATLAPAEVYAHKLELAAAADAAGFHGMFLAEHQGTPLTIDGSPSVLLSAIFQRTRRLRAGALAYCLPWHDPYRLYHEVCMIDQLSGGRLEFGVGRGVSPIESKIFGLGSIEESRERYREALEVFFQACGNPTLNFDGKLFHYRDAELHVQPLQKPYPPLWFPSSNRESIEFTARHATTPRFPAS